MSKKIGVFLLVFLSFFLFSTATRAEEDCETVEECRALLQEYETQIQEYQENIDENKDKQRTLNNKIYLLRQQIDQLNYKIRKSNLVIDDLQTQIEDTEGSIDKTEDRIRESRKSLITILRAIYEEDQKTSLEVFFGNRTLSGFFEDVFALERLLAESHELLGKIENLKSDLENQKDQLGVEEDEWREWKEIQILQKERSKEVKSEREEILEETKGEEQKYQELLAENRQKARKIRERIFSLIGVPEAPTFGEALELARYVEDITGVRAALILAVMRQESDIGKNVGQCYLRDFDTGDGVVASSGRFQDRVMKPSRDIDYFLSITAESGRDPKNTLVSCPMSFGWGGAMGPAQFIPSTWVHYRSDVASVTGSPADPWDIRDAFLAAGFYLKDAGASKQTYNAEWCAAMVYFSGSCSSGYDFYGESVMSLVEQYEKDIDQVDKYAQR